MPTPIVYLACPYTHPDPTIREARFEAVTRAAAALIEEGKLVFSPVTMTHPIDRLLAGHTHTMGSDFWVSFDEAFMEHCDEIIVLRVNGWNQSSGVTREIKFFEERGKRVSFLDPV